MFEVKEIIKSYETVLIGEQALVRVSENGEEYIRRTTPVEKCVYDKDTETLTFVTKSGKIYTNDQTLLAKYRDLDTYVNKIFPQ